MAVSWRSLILRIGERCQEYGSHADAEEHIVSHSYIHIYKRVSERYDVFNFPWESTRAMRSTVHSKYSLQSCLWENFKCSDQNVKAEMKCKAGFGVQLFGFPVRFLGQVDDQSRSKRIPSDDSFHIRSYHKLLLPCRNSRKSCVLSPYTG